MSESEDSFGPALPPGMQQAREHDTSSDDDQYGPALPGGQSKSVIHKEGIGPAIPARKAECVKEVIGPVLPSNFSKTPKDRSDSDTDSSSSSASSSFSDSDYNSRKKKKHKKSDKFKRGQSKESHDKFKRGQSKESHVIGPAMPFNTGKSSGKRVIGPSFPSGVEVSHGVRTEDSDDDVIGPSVGLQASEGDQSAVKDFELRSQRMMEKLASGTKTDEEEAPKKRESWMTELPEEMCASFGLGNRQFRTRNAPEQDSSWTEAPHEKGKKNKEGKKRKKDKDEYFKSDKDKKARKEIEAYNKKHRPESLLEMHKKEMKKKKKKEKKKKKDKAKERRPFDRDIDLKVNRFDDAMKKAYIKRSQELGSRFQSGGTGTSFL